MKLCNRNVAYELRIDPETEYDAMFTISPRRLAWIFGQLAKEETHAVTISVKEIQGVRKISFIKDSDMFRIDFPIFSNDRADIKMEKRIMEDGIQKAFCMKCLLKIIDESTVDSFDIDAKDVTLYMGADAITVMVYTYPALDRKEYRLPEANDIDHDAAFHADEVDVGNSKVVKNQKRERDEVNAEEKRPKLNPKDGDDIEEGEFVPEDGEIVPEDGDDAEQN